MTFVCYVIWYIVIIVSEDIYLCFHGTKPAGLLETLMPIYWTTQQYGVFCDSRG